ncbi:uncharacterized protein PHACADRAFT_30122 [Phanerochaete carnosa HHB-10118-sp]|uniref:Uncharacterized protein n=1 Tax=Phanerochaete carnosa (strain HHB-10118-sp) TaxID=650164 RepID=K5W1M0_PHACS|nr:uncharacterized protein PHACADRAFT_30122 [Phanerochaete carnosa HHB-10118-sp]EKM53010.1 hypothetical protein PHACADRAFT_30122 [Phanerochaete carnosa HHB-10118-sp]
MLWEHDSWRRLEGAYLAYLQPPLPLLLNAIAAVALTGLFPSSKDPRSGSLTARFQRRDVPPDLIRFMYRNPCGTELFLIDMPERRPFQLPPTEDAYLRASLGDYLGHGHSSIVFDLIDAQLSGASSETIIPPLVVKAARINRVISLVREAWFYDEMECLQ